MPGPPRLRGAFGEKAGESTERQSLREWAAGSGAAGELGLSWVDSRASVEGAKGGEGPSDPASLEDFPGPRGHPALETGPGQGWSGEQSPKTSECGQQ